MTDKPPVVIVCVGMAGRFTVKVHLGEKLADNLNPQQAQARRLSCRESILIYTLSASHHM